MIIFLASLFIAEPINSKFRKLPEGKSPEGVAELRDRWQRFHYGHTVGAVLALLT